MSNTTQLNRKCAMTALAVLLLITGCATDSKVIDNAQQMNGQLKPAIITDPELAGYLQAVGDRVIASAKKLEAQGVAPKAHDSEDASWMFSERMKFYFVNSDTLNAFTTGGEYMYIYTELFEQCTSEDELAAVVAHEFAHVYGRHVHKGMDRQYGALALAAGAAAGGAALGGKDNWQTGAAAGGGVGLAVGQFMNMGFTRKDEAEADKYGFRFYVDAGWDPNKFGDFFQHMIDKGYDKTPEMLSDHPTLKSRVDIAKKRAAELPPDSKALRKPPVADEAKFKALLARSQELGKKLPSDKTLSGSKELLQALPRSCVAPVDPPDAIKAREDIVRKANEQEQRAQQNQK